MNMMLIFDVVMLLAGIYMVGAGVKMKKTGEISSVVVSEQEIAKCRDRAGLIGEIWRKLAVFGGVASFAGVLGLLNDVGVFLGGNVFRVVKMCVFLVSFLWFINGMHRAVEAYS